jgi:hypothetical protein
VVPVAVGDFDVAQQLAGPVEDEQVAHALAGRAVVPVHRLRIAYGCLDDFDGRDVDPVPDHFHRLWMEDVEVAAVVASAVAVEQARCAAGLASELKGIGRQSKPLASSGHKHG